ncbi:hypothetical protein [Bifidobacterium sp. SO1]|uniref:hypothetical protein n=1 Tax=Bifidobacterium sp. SO1 TaxID=2809029 RepID=UPI001BDBF4C2|nr:hypothetical protein [Bifidobacterium sp. SO1]MBT1161206.1 hypothetical protein [Bifidobacterium sp. SO1]
MAAKNNTPIVSKETETDENVFPDTFDGLAARYPELSGVPAMTPAHEFTPAQSADFGVLDTLYVSIIPGIDEQTDDVQAALQIARLITVSDEFYAQIAKDKTAYEQWTRGRNGNVLFNAFTLLTMFYRNELGKSEASRTPTEPAPSN